MATLNTREFDRTFRQYMRFTSRDLATALNTKAFFIARRAVVGTHRADQRKIRSALGNIIQTKKGEKVHRLKKGSTHTKAPLAALILNARRGKKGLPGLYGAAMKTAIQELILAREVSVSFIRSGWIHVIKSMERFVDKRFQRGSAPTDRKSRQIGVAKGVAVPARPGFKAIARIINAASARHDKTQATFKYGFPALAAAVEFEAASMKQYIADKMRASAKSLGIRTR